jgi:alkylated DNA nucleotide flippase Atl1
MGVGIFVGIVARAAEEAKVSGEKNITPYWRTIKSGGELNGKYPGGAEAQAAHLKAEGHTIETKGKKIRVMDFEKKLVEL